MFCWQTNSLTRHFDDKTLLNSIHKHIHLFVKEMSCQWIILSAECLLSKLVCQRNVQLPDTKCNQSLSPRGATMAEKLGDQSPTVPMVVASMLSPLSSLHWLQVSPTILSINYRQMWWKIDKSKVLYPFLSVGDFINKKSLKCQFVLSKSN